MAAVIEKISAFLKRINVWFERKKIENLEKDNADIEKLIASLPPTDSAPLLDEDESDIDAFEKGFK